MFMLYQEASFLWILDAYSLIQGEENLSMLNVELKAYHLFGQKNFQNYFLVIEELKLVAL